MYKSENRKTFDLENNVTYMTLTVLVCFVRIRNDAIFCPLPLLILYDFFTESIKRIISGLVLHRECARLKISF